MSDFTPGPWMAISNLVGSERSVVCEVRDDFGFHPIGVDPTKEFRANARLISAAPELLEALEAMLDAYHDDPLEADTTRAVEMAMGAIAKARGE